MSLFWNSRRRSSPSPGAAGASGAASDAEGGRTAAAEAACGAAGDPEGPSPAAALEAPADRAAAASEAALGTVNARVSGLGLTSLNNFLDKTAVSLAKLIKIMVQWTIDRQAWTF